MLIGDRGVIAHRIAHQTDHQSPTNRPPPRVRRRQCDFAGQQRAPRPGPAASACRAAVRRRPPPCPGWRGDHRPRRPAIRLRHRGHLRGAAVHRQGLPGLTSFDKELLTSILLIGALIGALAGGRIADRAGRAHGARHGGAIRRRGDARGLFSQLRCPGGQFRVVIGLAVGSASMVVPHRRGRPAAGPRGPGQLQSAGHHLPGILISYLVDYGLASHQNWRLMFGLAAIPAVLMFTGMLFPSGRARTG